MQRPDLDPAQLDALVFDVIGTLVDEDETWPRVAERLAAAAGVPDTADLHARWVGLLDEHMTAVVEGEASWSPHQELVTESAREALADCGGATSPAVLALVASLDAEYPAWPEVAEATAALRRDRLVAGVSNGDLASLTRLANTNGISWDVVLSTGAVGTFKPDPAAYRYAIDTLGIDPARTLFVAAHPWDLRAAAEHGFRTVYVARPGAERPAEGDRFDVEVPDLAALVELLGAS